MLEIKFGENSGIALLGRFDASQAQKATDALAAVGESRVIDCANLEYISSAGLGVLLAVQKRLKATGAELRLVNVKHNIYNVFLYSGLDRLFRIEKQGN